MLAVLFVALGVLIRLAIPICLLILLGKFLNKRQLFVS